MKKVSRIKRGPWGHFVLIKGVGRYPEKVIACYRTGHPKMALREAEIELANIFPDLMTHT